MQRQNDIDRESERKTILATNTSVRNKELRFYKDGDGGFADVAGHTQAQNRMVAGADRLTERFAAGGSEVRVRLSADVADQVSTASSSIGRRDTNSTRRASRSPRCVRGCGARRACMVIPSARPPKSPFGR